MKRKERGCQEEVVHGMQVNAAQRSNDEHQEEKEEQRDGSEVADLSCQWPRLQLLRHSHTDLESRNQVRVAPGQVPAVSSRVFAGGRERVIGEVNVFEICVHCESKILHLRHTLGQFVSPAVLSLRAIAYVQ